MAAGDIIRLRRGTAASAASSNPVLALGEPGIESDTRKWKVGDGSTDWNSLSYMLGGDIVYSGKTTLSSGSATVSAAWVTANTVIVATPCATAAVPGSTIFVDPANIVVSTSFQIDSDDATDSRSVFWMATIPENTNVFQADNSVSAASFLQKNLGSDHSELWIKFDMAYTAATLSWWSDPGNQYSGDICVVRNNGTTLEVDVFAEPGYLVVNNWAVFRQGAGQSNFTDAMPSADAWHTYEVHAKTSDLTEFIIDGGTPMTTGAGNSDQFRKVEIGLQFGSNDAAQIAYFRNIKIGTTQGASDIFADDFSSGDFSNWTSTTGDCFVVSDPF